MTRFIFPDVRIEYQGPDGRWEREDIEVVTPQYRGAHGASVVRSRFSCYGGLVCESADERRQTRAGCAHSLLGRRVQRPVGLRLV
jgi:hypothetical protein